MEATQKKLQDTARRLLEEKRVDVLIGYEAGTLPLTATPCFLTAPEEADRLVYNAVCVQNLAKYVADALAAHRAFQKRIKPEDRKKKVIGVVARGCTTRSLILHLQERQYGRDEIVILGVPCRGYVDKRKLAEVVKGEEILEGRLDGDRISARTASGETTIPLAEVLADNCRTCRFNAPVLCDEVMGENAPAMAAEKEYDGVDAFAAKTPEERWAYFAKEMGKCIRCYACRQACPSCYCPTCFVEQSQPQWIGIGEDRTDTQVFQIMRLYHMVGRCVDCGSCVAVCPVGVDLRTFLKKLDKDVFELFGNRAGADLADGPPLATYREHDPEDFIYHP